MKLILTAAVDNLGVAGDIVEVKNGYGRNYLLPRGLAIVATRGAQKQIEGIRRAQEAREIRDLDHAKEVREQLSGMTGITIPVRTSDKGKIFGSVKAADIVEAVAKAGGPTLDKRIVQLPKGLVKSTGKYRVEAHLHDDVNVNIDFEVVSA